MVRKWCGFETIREPDRYYIAGLLFEQMPAPRDTAIGAYNPMIGQGGYLFPQGDGRVRAYVVYPIDANFVFRAKTRSIVLFRRRCAAEFRLSTTKARAIGPLASFISADHWVENPYRDGVVLIGDAAGASDPIWGQGLSLTCRDARVLTDFLRENQNWVAACRAYAQARDQYFRFYAKRTTACARCWSTADRKRTRAARRLYRGSHNDVRTHPS